MTPKGKKAERLADEELMPLIGDKDPEAFAVFYDRHGGVAFSLAYRIVGESGGRRRRHPGGLHLGLAQRRPLRPGARQRPLLDARDRPQPGDRPAAQQGGAAPKLDFDDDSILEQRPAEELTEDEALRRETAKELRGALGELPGEQSKVIELAYFGGFSHSEIAGCWACRWARSRAGCGSAWRRSAASWRRDWHERERHESRRDEIAAYLLGALEPEEAASLERHLARLRRLPAELRWLRPAVQMLPEPVERVEPPSELRGADPRRGAGRSRGGGPAPAGPRAVLSGRRPARRAGCRLALVSPPSPATRSAAATPRAGRPRPWSPARRRG